MKDRRGGRRSQRRGEEKRDGAVICCRKNSTKAEVEGKVGSLEGGGREGGGGRSVRKVQEMGGRWQRKGKGAMMGLKTQ